MFYAWFRASLDGVAVEEATSRGRLDMAVVLGTGAYLFEFKVAERAVGSSLPGSAGGNAAPPTDSAAAARSPASADSAALAQLKARRYADKYRAPHRTVHLIGVEISGGTRDVTAFDVEPA